jgi:hypothetical protein
LKKQTQLPAFGRKSEALNPKSEGDEWISNEKPDLKKQSQF